MPTCVYRQRKGRGESTRGRGEGGTPGRDVSQNPVPRFMACTAGDAGCKHFVGLAETLKIQINAPVPCSQAGVLLRRVLFAFAFSLGNHVAPRADLRSGCLLEGMFSLQGGGRDGPDGVLSLLLAPEQRMPEQPQYLHCPGNSAARESRGSFRDLSAYSGARVLF